MVTVCGTIANATLVVGYDVFSAAPFADFATAKYSRKVRKIYIVGDNAVASTAFDLQYGPRKQAIGIHNNQTALEVSESTGVPVTSFDMCAPDEKIMLVCTDAAAASDVMIKVEIV